MDIRSTAVIKGSPPFQFFSPEIPAGDFWIVDFESDDRLTQQYIPFDTCNIVNHSDSSINVLINQNEKHAMYMASHTITTLHNTEFTTLKIVNLDAVNVIKKKQVVVEPMLEGWTADKQAQERKLRFLRLMGWI